MGGILVWLLLIAVLVAVFIIFGGLRSPMSIIGFVVAVAAGVVLSFIFLRRR